MFVKDRMTKNVATVMPDDTVSKAFQVLVEKGHSQLPVVDKNGKLVGLITEKLLSEVSPSKATSLSVFEINYLLSKTKVSDIMKKEVFSIHPLALIEEAALIMKNNDIGSLPVISEDGMVSGIVTRLDIFSAFIEIMGVNDFGSRIAVEVEDRAGVLADIAGIIEEYGANITHITKFDYGIDKKVELVIRVDAIEVDGLLANIKNANYKITSVTTNK